MFGKELFRCVVEDNRDPEFLGRVRIRVIGVHDPIKKNVKVEELPWSDVLQPPSKGDILGGNYNVPIGTWGYCLALDDTFTTFLMIGSIQGIYPESPEIKEPIDNKEIGFRGEDDNYPIPLDSNKKYPCNPLEIPNGDHIKTEYTPITVDNFTEPENTAKNVEYPHNKVYEDHNGNIIEIDASKDNPRIRVQHNTGTRIDINTKGDVSIQASPTGNIWFETPGLYAIDADGNMIIEGDLKITGNLEVGIDITAGQNVTAKNHIDDGKGTLDSLRLQHNDNVATYNSHTHSQGSDSDGNSQVPTDPPGQPQTNDPESDVPDFSWIGNPV
jgi:hypothetical protein